MTIAAEERVSAPSEESRARGVVDVSIAIVTWNSAGWIERCLAAIGAACEGLQHEIVVHDNASSDGTVAIVERAGKGRLKLHADSENRGFAGGMNCAIEKSKGRYLLSLNPDCELARGSIATLVRYLDAHPEVAAAAPLLLDEQGQPQREFQLRRFPTLHTVASELLLLDKVLPSNGAAAHYRYRDLDITRPQPIEQPAAAALLLRAEVVRAIGAFDERFTPAWFEDVDYCRRMWERGFAIHLVPEAVATHRGGASLDHVPFATFVAVWYRNLFHYVSKWFTPGDAEAVRWLIIAGMMLRTLAAAIGPRLPVSRGAAVRAYVDVMKKAFARWDDLPRSF